MAIIKSLLIAMHPCLKKGRGLASCIKLGHDPIKLSRCLEGIGLMPPARFLPVSYLSPVLSCSFLPARLFFQYGPFFSDRPALFRRLSALMGCCIVVAVPALVAHAQQTPAQVCSTGPNVAMRVGPNQHFPVVASLIPGTPLAVRRTQVNSQGQNWSLVIASGYQGFIPAAHVCQP